MKLTMYKNVDGGTSMISLDNAFAEIRELGNTFAIALAERGHDTKESDLMSGLAAYHLLKLEGETRASTPRTASCCARSPTSCSSARVLSPELEAELARLGVKRPPAPPQPQTKYPKPWVPTYPGEDPPF
jgi:hypothetical protein